MQGDGRAYRFRHDSSDAIVAWAEEGEPTLQLAAVEAWVVDRHGDAALVQDGAVSDADGLDDGVLTLKLSIDPIVIWLDHARGAAGG